VKSLRPLLLALGLLSAVGYAAPMALDPVPDDPSQLLRTSAGSAGPERERLVELLQGELRGLAVRAMSSERGDHTLQPTALVNEVWLKLFEPQKVGFADRQHFLAVSAEVMRQVLVDHARARKRVKRGGGWQRVQLDAAVPELSAADADADGLDLVALDDALAELRELAPRQAQVVDLRFFAGLSVEETAEALELSERTVAREWRFARAWLAARLESQ